MRQERIKVIEKMSVPVGDAPRAQDQHSLPVLFGDAILSGGFGRGRFRKRLVNGGHFEIVLLCRLLESARLLRKQKAML